jgi:autotransporter-associated beta strand protein
MKRNFAKSTATGIFLACSPALWSQALWSPLPADDLWSNVANWDISDVPDTNTEIANFGTSTVQAVNLAAPITVKRLVFQAAAGDYSFLGSPFTVDVAQAGTGSGTVMQTLGAGTVNFAQLVSMSDAGGGNDSSLVATLASNSVVNFNGGMTTVSNRNFASAGDGTVNLRTSASTGTAQFQQTVNSTLNLFVNPTATGQIRSFSNTGGGVRLHANVTRALGLGVTGGTSHLGRIFLAANGVVSSGTLATTGATVAGSHNLDATFGIDIPGSGVATHSGAVNFGTLTSLAVNSGASWVLRLRAEEQDALTISGVISGFPTGYTNPVIAKQGPGTVTLTGVNTHTVPLEVAEGLLAISTAQTSAVAATVRDGGRLGVNVAAAGGTLNFTALNLSSDGGANPSSLELNAGTFGNPANPLVRADVLTVAGPTMVRVGGALTAAPGVPFPVIAYTSLGGQGFSGLSLALPFRASGNLVNDTANSRILVELTNLGGVAWRGSVNGNWDADSVGDGSTGTANWAAASGPGTYVQNAPVGTDSVVFDDTLTGTASVTLATTLTPAAISVSNNTANYTWMGSGSIAGPVGIIKNGSGSLVIANTSQNTNTAASIISEGSVVLGDGTPGAGSLGGAINVAANGLLRINRPDGLAIGALTGEGGLDLALGVLTLAGGNFTGTITGTGGLRTTANLALTGMTANNTGSGAITVAAGQLQLNRPGFQACGGDITLAGGTLAIQAVDQIADTASITLLGTSTDSIPTQTGAEVVKNVTVNSSTAGAAGGQMILRAGFTATGVATVNSGVLGVASAHTATLNAVNLTCAPGSAGILRIAANSAASTLNIGAGGITASGGEIQVKFNTNNQDGVLNLAGDFTATGDVVISNGNYTGSNLNVVNLINSPIFNIAPNTTTTVAPDIGGTGSLTKNGGGTLVLGTSCIAAHTDTTAINQGTLQVDGAITSSLVFVVGGQLTGNGIVQQGTTAQSGAVVSAGAATPGLLTFQSDLTMEAGSLLIADISGATTHDKLAVSGTFSVQATVKPTLAGYTPVAGDVFDLADAAAIVGMPPFDFSAAPLTAGLVWDTSQFVQNGSLRVVAGGNPYSDWAAQKGLTATNNAPMQDADNDGVVNALEFYLDGNPLDADQPGLAASVQGGNLRLAYRRRDDAEAQNVVLESSEETASGWQPLVAGVNGVLVNVVENGADPDDVEVLVPVAAARRFARLRLTLP